MAIEVDKSAATKLLYDSFKRCSEFPENSCPIKGTIDFVMNGKNCLTYRYIMFTALVAKAVTTEIDILSLQAKDSSEGAYDPRTLAKEVVYPFQKTMLGNVLDGSNNDPLVNKPARVERLKLTNAVAGGDPKVALYKLCTDLPKIQTLGEARKCVDYIVSELLAEKKIRDQHKQSLDTTAENMSIFQVRQYLSDLLDQGFGGAALVIVTTALYHLHFDGEEYKIEPHPVNQSGTSRRQFSDLDLFRDNKPYMGTELKDKPFTDSDVVHAAKTAYKAGAKSLLFVAGRQSTFASQPPTYFADARKEYSKLGMYVGVTSIDALMDIIFSSYMGMNAGTIIEAVSDAAEKIGALEAQMWVYKQAERLNKYLEAIS